MAYHPMQIRRVSKYEFLRGRPVFLLRSPQGTTWVMQTFTDHIDHDLRESDLPGLAARLALPEGWQYKAATLNQDLTITTDGVANIVPDNLANMYRGPPDDRRELRPLWSQRHPARGAYQERRTAEPGALCAPLKT